jgi:chromosome partitioning protein
MMYESIPFNWEMLSLVGGAGVLGAGGTWKLAQAIYSENRERIKRARKLDRLLRASNDQCKEKDRIIAENATLIAALKKDLDRTSAEVPNDYQDTTPPRATLEELDKRVARYEELRSALLGEEDEAWRLRELSRPPDFLKRMEDSHTKVVTVINLKGGVAKTTIVANLAIHFGETGKRVLAIDFDYQGSLTRTMVLGARLPLGTELLAAQLLGGTTDGKWLAKEAFDLRSVAPNVKLVTCGQTFDSFEFKLMLKWLLNETEDDIRFRLAALLLSQEVQRKFDLVLIDAPPRLSTGAINALCASHAILVPTILDELSVDAVRNFLQRAAALRELNPALEFAGVIGTITDQTELHDFEKVAQDKAEQALSHWEGRSRLFAHRLRYFRALARAAGRDLGYKEDGGVRAAFSELGQELESQVSI